MTEEFLAVMDSYNEFVFGEFEQVRKQLEICLNSQGYWSGCSIKVFYDNDNKKFYVENRF
jgi:hypothetical protein